VEQRHHDEPLPPGWDGSSVQDSDENAAETENES
jgi:hypothetical protein